MKPVTLSDETRRIGAPANWDEARLGPCLALSVHDRVREGIPEMVSAWLPDDEELVRLQQGAPLYLTIAGSTHPVVALAVGNQPVPDLATDLARDIAATIAASVAARIDIARSFHPTCRLLVSPPRITGQGVAIEFVSVSPLEIVPPEFADWPSVGPFREPTCAGGGGE